MCISETAAIFCHSVEMNFSIQCTFQMYCKLKERIYENLLRIRYVLCVCLGLVISLAPTNKAYS